MFWWYERQRQVQGMKAKIFPSI